MVKCSSRPGCTRFLAVCCDCSLRECYIIRHGYQNLVLISLDRGALEARAKMVDFPVHPKAASRWGMVAKISCAGLTQAPQLGPWFHATDASGRRPGSSSSFDNCLWGTDPVFRIPHCSPLGCVDSH